jgi:hypothetical protein
MKEKIRFEFFIAEKKIFSRFMLKQKIKELVKHTYAARIKLVRSYDGIDRLHTFYKGFYSFEVIIDKGHKKEAWELAGKICSLDGVRGGGPLFTFSGRRSDEPPVRPDDLRWNHKATFFDDAIKKARKDGRLVGNKKTGIRIVQLDTGFTKHQEVYRGFNLWYDRNFIERNKRRVALDTVPEHEFINPGHGTSTAGVVIGRGIKTGKDFNEGLFPWALFIPYRMTTSVIQIGGGMLSAAIRHAVDKARCDVITMSIGGLPLFFDWEEAVNYAYRKGVILTASAGNYIDFVVWPARYDNVIGVGGTNPDNTPWDGSCHGSCVNISAPASQLYVPRVERHNEKLKFFYEVTRGTSFSAPHVAAAAALWLHYFKEELSEDFYRLAPWRRVDAFRYALYTSATRPPGWKEKNEKEYGVGILNGLGLLNYNPADKRVKEAIEPGKSQEEGWVDRYVAYNKQDFSENLKRLELLYELGNAPADEKNAGPEKVKTRVTSRAAAYTGEIVKKAGISKKDTHTLYPDTYTLCNHIADELTGFLHKDE